MGNLLYPMQIKPLKQLLTDRPVCSVCIANYNGIGVIDECLNSIRQQDSDFQIEVIVHDDASSDGSVEFIQQQFPEVILIKSEENVGFCVSNNRMVKKARGKYILLLNNDATLHSDVLSTFYEHAERINKPAILGVRQLNALTGDLIDFGIFLDPFMNSIPNKDFGRTDVAMVLGACLWLPKKLWEEIGGFPSWFHTMHEDMYVCCMARLLGYPVQMINRSGYKHWVGKSLGGGKVVKNRLSTRISRRALSERNRIFVMVLCYPNPIFSIIFPLHILILLLEGVILSFFKKDFQLFQSIYWSSIQSFWKKRKDLFLFRKKIQGRSRMKWEDFIAAMSPIPYKLKMLMKHGFPEIY